MNRLKKNGKPILWVVLVAFLVNTIFAQQPVQADVPFLPVPGQLVSLTPSFSPPLIRGLKIFKDNPFKFEFVMSQGDITPNEAKYENSSMKQTFLKEEADRLVKYFLASLTVPEKDMWVNLSPYEHNRIVPNVFGITEMGKEVLAQDYLLKQVTASVMYPEGDIGREFWHKIYQEAYKRFGTTNIPVNTFNKVWIVPDKAVVYENAGDNTAVIIESKLKVMLEEDYLAISHRVKRPNVIEGNALTQGVNALGSQIIREIIIPQLTKEVNCGKNFANLRQVYNSLILASWYKNKLKQSLIGKGYVNRKKTNGLNVDDKNIDQEIYNQYLKSYKKGVYNYIKEEISPTDEIIPRKYFSGGVTYVGIGNKLEVVTGQDNAQLAASIWKRLRMFIIPVIFAAAFVGFGASNASAQQPLVSAGAHWAEVYSGNHTGAKTIIGSARESNEYRLIQSAIEKGSNGEIKLGWGGVRELVDHSLIRINGNIVQNLNEKLSNGPNTVSLDLEGIRKIVSEVRRVHSNPETSITTGSKLNTQTISVPIIKGDSLSKIFADTPEIQQYNSSLTVSERVTIEDLIKSGRVSVSNRNEVRQVTPSNTLIRPGEFANITLSGNPTHATTVSGQPTSTTTSRRSATTPQTSGPETQNTVQFKPLPFNQLAVTIPPTLLANMDLGGLQNQHPWNDQQLITTSQATQSGFATSQQVLEALVRGHFNYHGTEIKIKMGNTASTNFRMIQDIIFTGPNKILGVIGSLDRNNLNAPQLKIRSAKELKDFLYRKGTVTIAKAVPLHGEPLDLADIRDDKKFPRINAADVFQYEKEGRPFITYVQYTDDNGVQHDGILWAGEAAAQAKADLMKSALHDLEMQKAIVHITNIFDPVEQRKELAKPEYVALFKDAKIPATGLITTAYIIPDIWDNIGRVQEWMVKGAVDTKVQTLPFQRASLVATATNTELEYVSSRPGVWMQFAEISPQKAGLLRDPVHGSQYLNQYVPDKPGQSYQDAIEQTLQKPRYMIGPNSLREDIADNQIAKYAAEQERDDVAKNLELQRARLNMSIVLDAVSLTMSGFGVAGGGVVQALGNVAFDLTHTVQNTLPGPIAEERKDEILGWWLYSDSHKNVHITFEEYLHSLPQFKDWTAQGYAFRTNTMTEDQVAKADYFLRSRMNEALVSKFMGVSAELATLAGQSAGLIPKAGQIALTVTRVDSKTGKSIIVLATSQPKLFSLASILTQPFIDWDLGSIHLLPVAELAITGKALNFVSINDMIKGGFKPSMLLPYIDLSLNTRSALNGLNNAINNDPLNPLFINAPQELQLDLDLPFLHPSLRWKISNLKTQLSLFDDNSIGGITVVDELFRSHSFGYTPDELHKLSMIPGEAVITTASISDGHKQIRVPVYVKYDQVSGKKTIIILKANMIQQTIDELEKKFKTYTDFERSTQIGATSTQVTAEYGTYRQHLPTGLFAENDQGGTIHNPRGMSQSQLELSIRAIDSHDLQKARDMISFFYKHLKVNTKLGEQYAGTPESMDVETGIVALKESHEATALFGISLLRFHQAFPNEKIDPQDTASPQEQVQSSLKMVHDRLQYVAYHGMIENANVAYKMFAFFDQYGDTRTANYILQGAKSIWDPNARLMRYRAAEPGFASESTLGWMTVLGPERFAQEFLGGADKTDELINVTRAIYHTFGEQNGKALKLIDAADNILRPPQHEPIGMVAHTSYYVGVMKQILTARLVTPLTADQRQELHSGIDFYSKNLRAMQNPGPNPSIPESDNGGVPTGVDFFTAIGKKSLGAYIAYETNVLNDANLLSPSRRNISLPPLPNADLVTANVLGVTQIVPADIKTRTQLQRQMLGLDDQQRKGHFSPDGQVVDWIDRTNAQEITVSQNGVSKHIVIMPSEMEVKDYVALVNLQLENARRYGEALSGEGQFASGGVLIHRIAGNTVGGEMRVGGQEVLNSADMKEIMRQLSLKTSMEKHQFERQRYANITADIELHGVKGKYVLSFVFPMHKETAITITDPDSMEKVIAVFNDEGLKMMDISAAGITVHQYNALKIESGNRTYRNILDYNKMLANPNAYLAQVRHMLAANQLTLDTEEFTTDYTDITATNDQQVLTRRIFIDHRTGNIEARSYGVHPQPIQIVNKFFVTTNHFNAYGRLQKSEVRDNATDFVGELAPDILKEHILNPIPNGTLRYTNTTLVQDNERTLERFKGHLQTIQHDVVHNTNQTIVTDGEGRVIGGEYDDLVNTVQGKPTTLHYATSNMYDPNFFGGRVPVLSYKINMVTGKIIFVTKTLSYDPKTQITIVEETNTRTGEIIKKTIDPQFGQVTKDSKIDSLNRHVITTNKYTFDQLGMTSNTTINGFVADTTKGTYDVETKQWNLDKTRFNQHGNDAPFVQETNKLHLTVRGHLIYQDHIFPQNTYSLLGETYNEENRRDIPEYDAEDNISRITEGVLKKGVFVPQQFTDFSGYGDFFAAKNSSTTRIVNGQPILFATGQLLTTPQDYWRTGRLDFNLTSSIYGDQDQWIESRDKEGDVLGKIEQARDDQNNVIGERVTTFSNFDAQSIPRVANAVIHQKIEGKDVNTNFSTSTDATTLKEAQLGLVRSQITNNLNGVVSQELKDRRGRVIQNPIGFINSDNIFMPQRRTIFNGFDDFDIAHKSYTESMLDGNFKPYTTSELLSNYNDIIANQNISFLVKDSFHHTQWVATKDYRGRVINTDKSHWDKDQKKFTHKVIVSRYNGIPGLMDVADSSWSNLLVNDQQLMWGKSMIGNADLMPNKGVIGSTIDESNLMTAQGEIINGDNVNSVPANAIWNGINQIRYQGTSYYEDPLANQHYQGFLNPLGNEEIMALGHLDDNNGFVRDHTEYSFYETGKDQYGNFDTASTRIATNIDPKGTESITDHSNNTRVDDTTTGDIIYKRITGISPFELSNGPEEIYNFLENNKIVENQMFLDGKFSQEQIVKIWGELVKNGYINSNGVIQAKFGGLKKYSDMELPETLEAQKERIYNILQQSKSYVGGHSNKFTWVKGISEDHMSGEGKLQAVLTGSQDTNQEEFPLDNSAKYISFFSYPQFGDDRLAKGSNTYLFMKPPDNELVEPKESDYKGQTVIAHDEYSGIAIAEDRNGNKTPVIVYDSTDNRTDKLSISGRATRFDGRLFAEHHKGDELASPETIVFFNNIEFPDYTQRMFGGFIPALSDNTKRQDYKEHFVALEKGKNGFYWVWDSQKFQWSKLLTENEQMTNADWISGKQITEDRFTKVEGVEVFGKKIKLVYPTVAETMAERNGTQLFRDEIIEVKKSKYSKEVLGVVNKKGKFRPLAGYFDFFRGFWENISSATANQAVYKHPIQTLLFVFPVIAVGLPIFLSIVLLSLSRFLVLKWRILMRGNHLKDLLGKDDELANKEEPKDVFSRLPLFDHIKNLMGPTLAMTQVIKYLTVYRFENDFSKLNNSVVGKYRDFFIAAIKDFHGKLDSQRSGKKEIKNGRNVAAFHEINEFFKAVNDSQEKHRTNPLEEIKVNNIKLQDIIEKQLWSSDIIATISDKILEYNQSLREKENSERLKGRSWLARKLLRLPVKEEYPSLTKKPFLFKLIWVAWNAPWKMIKMLAIIFDTAGGNIGTIVRELTVAILISAGIAGLASAAFGAFGIKFTVFFTALAPLPTLAISLVALTAAALLTKLSQSEEKIGDRQTLKHEKEQGRFHRIVIREWLVSVVSMVALYIKYAVPVFFVAKKGIILLSIGHLIGFTAFLGLMFWAVSSLNLAALSKIIRTEKHIDNLSNWKSVGDAHKVLFSSPIGDAYRIFYRRLIDDLRNPNDQIGRGPVISKDEYDSYMSDNLNEVPSSAQAKDSIRNFINKWLAVNAGNGKAKNGLSALNNAKEAVLNMTGKNALRLMFSAFNEKVWVMFDELDLNAKDAAPVYAIRDLYNFLSDLKAKKLGKLKNDEIVMKLKKLLKNIPDALVKLSNREYKRDDKEINKRIASLTACLLELQNINPLEAQQVQSPIIETYLDDSQYILDNFIELKWDQLDKISDVVISHFQKLMRTNTVEWDLFVSEYINKDIKEIPPELLANNLKNNPRAAAEAVKLLMEATGRPEEKVKTDVEQWANWYLEDLGKSLVSTVGSLRETFTAWAEVLKIPKDEIDGFVNSRFKILFAYGAFFVSYRRREWERLKSLYGNLFFISDIKDIDFHIAQTNRGSITKQVLSKAGLNPELVWSELIARNYIDSNGLIQSKFMGFNSSSDMILSPELVDKEKEIYIILKHDALVNPWEFSDPQNTEKPVMVYNPAYAIGSHGSKVGAWPLRWPYLDTEVALAIDSGHRFTFDSLMFTPYIMELFNEQKRLGAVVPIYKTYYEDFTSTSQALSKGHKVWDGRIRSVKDYVDSENDYGKKFFRVAAFTSSDAFIPEKNSEDTVGGNLMIQHGWDIRHTELVDIVQSVEKTHYYGRAFVERFGATVPELMKDVAWWSFLVQKNVHWSVKFGTLRDFSHYFRIALMAVSVFSFITSFMMFPFSPYIYFPLAIVFALVNYMANQSVNALTIEDYIADNGFFKGIGLYSLAFWNLLYTYVSYEGSNVLQYITGQVGVNTFSLSSRMSNMTRVDFWTLYNTPTVNFSIKMAALLTAPILLTPYGLVSTVINGLFVILVSAWANPFMLNVRTPWNSWKKGTWKEILIQRCCDFLLFPMAAFGLAWLEMLGVVKMSNVLRVGFGKSKEYLKKNIRPSGPAAPSPNATPPKAADRAMQVEDHKPVNSGGIDFSRTAVNVESSGDRIQTAFNDPAMLQFLLNSDGLTPVIDDIKKMTPLMVNHFVGLN